MNTLTPSRPSRTRTPPRDRPAPYVGSSLGRYTDSSDGQARHIVALPGAGGSTLVIDRLADTLEDLRLVAHLASDEPAENARVVSVLYLAEESKPKCRPLRKHDLTAVPFAEWFPSTPITPRLDEPLLDPSGIAYRVRCVSVDGSFPELRWTCSLDLRSEDSFRPVRLREVIGRLQEYEPARTITAQAITASSKDGHTSTHRLRGELERLNASPIVLNRRLREVVLRATANGQLTMSEIAIRCGRIKRDMRGNVSGETSWLARRIGQLPEGGEQVPGPWVHSDVLALIAREGLGVSPREVEL